MAWNREREDQASDGAKRNAAVMRRSMTEAEKRLWNMLRYDLELPKGAHFRRQFALGSFIADFACLECRLIIEVDGALHKEDTQMARDALKDSYFRGQGFEIMRFDNEMLMLRRSEVMESLGRAISSTTPIRPLSRTPSPQGGRLEASL